MTRDELRAASCELRAHLREVLDAEAITKLVTKYRIQQRERNLDVFKLIVALILAGGTHAGGRQYDVLRTYVDNGAPRIVRGTFYAWFTEPLLELLANLLDRAIAIGLGSRHGARQETPHPPASRSPPEDLRLVVPIRRSHSGGAGNRTRQGGLRQTCTTGRGFEP